MQEASEGSQAAFEEIGIQEEKEGRGRTGKEEEQG